MFSFLYHQWINNEGKENINQDHYPSHFSFCYCRIWKKYRHITLPFIDCWCNIISSQHHRFRSILWIRRMINNKWQKKKKASISVSFLSCIFSLSLFALYLLFNLSNVNQKNDKKIHLDEKEEKSALLFYVYMFVHREIIMRIRSKRIMLWTFISFVRSLVLSLTIL